MAQGFGHEAKFDPLAALLESPENSELIHFAPVRLTLMSVDPYAPKEKARPIGRAFVSYLLLYTYSISIRNRRLGQVCRKYILCIVRHLEAIERFLSLDKVQLG